MTYYIIKSPAQTLEDAVLSLYTRSFFNTFEEAQLCLEENYEDTCKVYKLTVSYEHLPNAGIKAILALEPC